LVNFYPSDKLDAVRALDFTKHATGVIGSLSFDDWATRTLGEFETQAKSLFGVQEQRAPEPAAAPPATQTRAYEPTPSVGALGEFAGLQQPALDEPISRPPSASLTLPSVEELAPDWFPERNTMARPGQPRRISIDDSGAAPGPGPLPPAGAGSPLSPQPVAQPTAGGDEVDQAALTAGVDPVLFRRLVGQESGGDQGAVSPMGAKGAAQLMPGTAAYLAKKYGLDTSTRLGNLTAGAYYLKEQLDQFGSVPLALAAYNAGPGAVQKHGGIPPFAETQKYVQIIGSGYQGSGRAPTAPESTPARAVTPSVGGSGEFAGVAETAQASQRSLEGITPDQFGLGDADAEAICGPVLLMAFQRSEGRNPTIAEAKALATRHGNWTSAQGMGGPYKMAETLRAAGTPAVFEEGALNLEKIRRDVANGNPVGINTRGHYFVVEGVDEQGRLNLGNSAKILKASGGRQWFRPEEIASLGMGAPTGAIYKDSPSSPNPSVAVRDTGMPSVSGGLANRLMPQQTPMDEAGGATTTPEPTLGERFSGGLQEIGRGLGELGRNPAELARAIVPPQLRGLTQAADTFSGAGTRDYSDLDEADVAARARRASELEDFERRRRERGGTAPTEPLQFEGPGVDLSGPLDRVGRLLEPELGALGKLGEGVRAVGDRLGQAGQAIDTGPLGPVKRGVEDLTSGIAAGPLTGLGRLAAGDEQIIREQLPNLERYVRLEEQLANGDEAVRPEMERIVDQFRRSYSENRFEAAKRNPQLPEYELATGLAQGAAATAVAPGLAAGAARNIGASVLDPFGQLFATGLEIAGRSIGAAARTQRTAGAPALGIVDPVVARGLGSANLPEHPVLEDAVRAAGGEITLDGIRLSLQRFQPPEAAGLTATRGGVWYSPEQMGRKSPYQGGLEQGVGGTEKIRGETLLRRPLVLDNAFIMWGAPERVMPPELAKELWFDVSHRLFPGGQIELTPAQIPVAIERAKDILTRYGGEPEMAEQIVRGQPSTGEMGTAIVENVIGQKARAQGYDSIIAINQGEIWEVADLREAALPGQGVFKLRAEFQPDPLRAEAKRLGQTLPAGRGNAPGAQGIVDQNQPGLFGNVAPRQASFTPERIGSQWVVVRSVEGETPTIVARAASQGDAAQQAQYLQRQSTYTDIGFQPRTDELQPEDLVGGRQETEAPRQPDLFGGLGIVSAEQSRAFAQQGQPLFLTRPGREMDGGAATREAFAGGVAGAAGAAQDEDATPGEIAAGFVGGAALGRARSALPGGARTIGRISQAVPEQAPREGAEATAAARASREELEQNAQQVQRVPTSRILADPERFQFKSAGVVDPKAGVTSQLRDVEKWDDLSGGVLYLWEDEAGQVFVVNGHHRLDLAKRLKVPEVNAVIDREADGISAAEARARGALTNVRGGNGEPTDVARFLKDTGGDLEALRQDGVSPRSRLATRGAALAQLDEGLFQRVLYGQLDEDAAVIIGAELPGDVANQRAVADILATRELNQKELRALIAEARGDVVRLQQETLFGTDEVARSTLVERAKLRAYVQEQLSKDRRLFGFVGREERASELARGQNRINVEASQKLAQESARAEAYFNALAGSEGEVAQALRAGAEQLIRGEQADAVKRETLEAVRAAIVRESERPARSGGNRPGQAAPARPAGANAAPTRPAEPAPQPARAVEPEPVAAAPAEPAPEVDLFGEPVRTADPLASALSARDPGDPVRAKLEQLQAARTQQRALDSGSAFANDAIRRDLDQAVARLEADPEVQAAVGSPPAPTAAAPAPAAPAPTTGAVAAPPAAPSAPAPRPTPAPAPAAAAPPATPPGGTPPTPPPPPPSGPTPPTVAAAEADFDKIMVERQAVAGGKVPHNPTPNDVQEVLGGLAAAWTEQITDRRGKLLRVERYLEEQTGAPLAWEQRAWIRSRVYEGRSDAAIAWLERMVGPQVQAVRKEDQLALEAFLEQMDNIDKGQQVARRAESAAQAQAAQTGQAAVPGLAGQAAMGSRKFSGGASVQDEASVRAALTRKLGPERSQRIFEAAESIWRATDAMRMRMMDAGLYNDEAVGLWRDNFPHYIRSQILEHMDDAELDRIPDGGRTFSVGSNGYQRLTDEGTTKARRSPLSTLIDMAIRTEDLVRRNEIMQAVERWADAPATANFVKRLKADEAVPRGYTTFSVFEGGSKHRLAVVDELAPALEMRSPGATGLVGVALRAFSEPLRLGATALRPAFIATNAVNDALWTLYRFAVEAPDPVEGVRAVTDLVHGYAAALGGDPGLVQRAREAGASISTKSRFNDPDTLARELAGDRVWVRTVHTKDGLSQLLKDGWGATTDVAGLLWSRPLGVGQRPIEQAPRLAAYARAERQGARATEAALASRAATVDFDAGGLFTKAATQLVPFFNATTQASKEFADLVRGRPIQSGAALATVLSAVIANEIYNRSVAPEDYADVNGFLKRTGLVFLSDKAPEGEGKRGLLYVPLRGGLGTLVPLVRETMGRMYGDDPQTWQALAAQVIGTLSPIEPETGGALGAVIPPVGALGVELASNYDLYRDAPIVPKGKESLPTSEQYDERTSQAARALSRSELPLVGGQSPMKIDYAVKGFSPGPGEALLGVADALIHASGQALPEAPEKGTPGARDVPLVGGIAGRFLRTTGNERQNQAYEKAEQLADRNRRVVVDAVMASPAYQNATPDRQRQLLRSVESELVEQTKALSGVVEKPKDLGLPARFYGVPAGSEREKDILSAINTPKAKRTPRQQALVGVYEGMENPLSSEARKKDSAETEQARKLVEQSISR
jgi:hypothetical protein